MVMCTCVFLFLFSISFRLRQACNHFHLLSTALSNSTDEDTDGLSDALASLSLHQHDKVRSGSCAIM